MSTPARAACRTCRAPLGQPDAPYCSRCGTNQDVDVLGLVSLGDVTRTPRRPPGGRHSGGGVPDAGVAPSASGRGWFVLGAAAVAAMAILALLGRDPAPPPAPAAAPTTTITTPTTRVIVTDLASRRDLAVETATALGRIALPLGLAGYLYGLGEDGSLVEIDLVSGAARGWQLPNLDGKSPVRLHAVTSGLVVSSGGLSLAVPYDGGPARASEPVAGTIIGAGEQLALVDVDSDTAGFLLIDGAGRRTAAGRLGPERRLVAPSGERIVVSATGRAMLYDPAGATPVVALFAGDILASDGFGVAWLDCAAVLSCSFRIGSWAAPSQVELVPPLRAGGAIEAAFTTGLRRLIVTSSGPGGSSSFIVEPDSGASRPLFTTSPSKRATTVTADGRWLITLPADQSERAIVFEALSGDERPTTVTVPKRFSALVVSPTQIVEAG